MKQRLHPLCVALLALVLCNTPLFAHDFEVGGMYYDITSKANKTVAVTYRGSKYNSYTNEYSGTVTIPESVTYSGSTYSVTSIGNSAFEYCSSLTSVEIPNSVTSIGEAAFGYCSGLTSVVIPNSVTSIGTYAFTNCSNLTSVEIPNSVTSIGAFAFVGCSSLTSLEIPNSVTSIEDGAFSGCSGLTSVEIPNSVTSIGFRAFYYCSGLTSVEIPNSVTSIGEWAFGYCTSLTSVEIPNSVTSIGDFAFCYCSSLTSVEIPNSVTSIGVVAFAECSSLTTATVGCSWKTNPLYDFGENVTVNATLHSYENGVCKVCGDNSLKFAVDGIYYNITSETDKTVEVTYQGNDSNEYSGAVVLPESVTYNGNIYRVTRIGDGAFKFCEGLVSVEIPNGIISIGEQAFWGCDGLTSVVIPNSVTNVWSSVFYACDNLTSVVIGDNVTSIEANAFYRCTSLTSVVIGKSVKSIANDAFYYCSSLTSLEIPNSVTSIGNRTFYRCSSLTSVVIPNSMTNIGTAAFALCSGLTSVEIPNSVTRIEEGAFLNCSALTTATVGCSWKNNPLYDFGENVTVNPTLHSYENGVCTVCGEASEDEGERIELVEGTPFENEEAREVAQVTYNRTLPNLEWNALYLPVEIPVAALSENYDLAYFNNMHAYDRNNDGTVDEMDMEVFLINEGTLHANYPYFIRAKSEDAKQLQLVLTDVVLHAAEETSLTCSSVFIDFALTGVYARNDAETLSGCYAINTSGAWSPIAAGSYLNPFRCYLKMTARDGSPVKVDEALQTIRIRVHGEGGTTGIDNMTINGQQPAAIYDLQGRRVMVPQKGKIYIVGGKKKVF